MEVRIYSGGILTHRANTNNVSYLVNLSVGNLTLYNQLKQFGLDVKRNKLRGLNHAKMVIVDERIVTVGSHNFSENAWSRNEEASIISDDKEFVKSCQNYFNITFANCY